MEEVKILAIGNSFSQDATHYLKQIGISDGISLKVVNLYIGGCSLERHWHNIEENAKLYLYERDGISTEQYVSIRDALLEENWDFIVTQQASHDSGIKESYYPYIINLFNYIKEYSPNAEIILHQTWAYEIDSTHDCFERYHNSQEEMYNKLSDAYEKVANDLGIRLIPCGDVVQNVRNKEPFTYDKGGVSLCRDGFHMSYIYGRYLVAATWYEFILGNNIMQNNYIPKDILTTNEKTDLYALNVIKECVHSTVCKGV